MRTLRIALAQINTTVGDLDGNTAKVLGYTARARDLGADLVAFPELAITGYPPEDLLFKHQFIDDNRARMRQVVEASEGITSIVGFVDSEADLHNAAAVAHDGRLAGVYHKMFTPNYGVFDEERYFKAGRECPVYVIGGVRVGVNVCEDIWQAVGPTVVQRAVGAEVIVNISASPFYSGKIRWRENMLATRASDNGVFVAYVNLVGGQDELVFDGASIVFDPFGEVVAMGSQFEEDLIVADLDIDAVFPRPGPRHTLAERKLGPAQTGRVVARIGGVGGNAGFQASSAGARSDAIRRNGRGIRGAGDGHARLHRQVGVLPEGAHRALGGSGLQPGCDHRRRRSRPGLGVRPLDAVAVLVPGEHSRRPRACGEPWHRAEDCSNRGRILFSAGNARSPLRGIPAGPCRGEPPVAHPRPARDGDVQQVRVARPHDGQQERACGRLRDHLRRHGWRVRRHQGRAEDAGL